MKHEIGTDYSDIVKSRKGKRELPFVMKLKQTVDVDRLVYDLGHMMESARTGTTFGSDQASSEFNYNLSNIQGVNFVDNYEEVYRNYSKIGLQSLTDDAVVMAIGLPRPISDYTPYERARGMRNTGNIQSYHPHYDERNYTKRTQYCTGYVADLLDSFVDEPCRSAFVALDPGKFLSPHFDIGPEYVVRLQIPLITNPDAVMGFRRDPDVWEEFHFPADGSMYIVNSGWEHYAVNNGHTARFNLRICLNGQECLKDATEVIPNSIFSHEVFSTRPESGSYFGSNSNNLMSAAMTELGMQPETYAKYAAAKL